MVTDEGTEGGVQKKGKKCSDTATPPCVRHRTGYRVFKNFSVLPKLSLASTLLLMAVQKLVSLE